MSANRDGFISYQSFISFCLNDKSVVESMKSLDTNISGGYQNPGGSGVKTPTTAPGSISLGSVDRMDRIEDESLLTESAGLSRVPHLQPPLHHQPPSGVRRARSTRNSNSRF